jgi:hypothetical protein
VTDSRMVAWFEVYAFVAPLLAGIASRPAAGTPAWCQLPDDDPRKLAAVLEAGVHMALKIDAEQAAKAEASQAISTAADWKQVARNIPNYEAHRIRRAS